MLSLSATSITARQTAALYAMDGMWNTYSPECLLYSTHLPWTVESKCDLLAGERALFNSKFCADMAMQEAIVFIAIRTSKRA